MSNEIRVRQGVDAVIRIKIPVPYNAASAPGLIIHLPDGEQEPVFAALHPPAPFDAGGVDNVGRKITLSAPLADPVDVVGDGDGDVYVGVSGGGVHAARAESVDGAVLSLATPLARSVAQSGVVYWATFTATLSADEETREIGSYRYTVDYEIAHGGTESEPARIEGVLIVERQPWPGTGLTHHWLVEKFPELRHLPEGQATWEPQIEMTREQIAARLVSDLGFDRGDRILGASGLTLAHAFLLLELHYIGSANDTSDMYRDKYDRAYGEVMGGITLADDETGEPEEIRASPSFDGGGFTVRNPSRRFRGRGR